MSCDAARPRRALAPDLALMMRVLRRRLQPADALRKPERMTRCSMFALHRLRATPETAIRSRNARGACGGEERGCQRTARCIAVRARPTTTPSRERRRAARLAAHAQLLRKKRSAR
jgi:hypothetical protein